ncbi:MAG: alpha-glucan family phosphorylase [Marinilabiliaceae bacterium]|nr:alpha-glucan family phosphorylase [Marinilabiliaceae bacterium]
MIDSYLKPDYVFETSWEVCNKMGGIHTVLATKAQTLMQQLQDNLIFIGPDVWRGPQPNPEFIEDKSLFADWQEVLLKEGFHVKVGRWNVVSKPIALLIDFSPFVPQKNDILSSLWEKYKVDSISGQWDYVEPVLFGYAAAKVIESFYNFKLNIKHKVIAHFNEWMTGSGVLILKNELPQIATVFTTHATTVGRSLSGNGQSFYDNITEFDGDLKAHELGVVSKHSIEKIAANQSDCFTTVSEITAKECRQFFGREVDVVTPNGFEEDFVPTGVEFEKKRSTARNKLKTVTEALLGYSLSDDTIFIANSGRYEYKNKGIDVFMDALKLLNEESSGKFPQIVAFVLIPANTYGPRKDLKDKLTNNDSSVKLENPFLTHGLNDLGYDPIINKIQDIHLSNDATDKVKLIFVPSYLNGNDGIFNMPYYDILIGMDLTVFPSYYEPWGYTPVESLAFKIPTITTSLAGFGIYASTLSKGINDGIEIITRNDSNHQQTTINIANIIKTFCSKTNNEVTIIREKAQKISSTVEWDTLIKHYFKAFDLALKEVNNRKDQIAQIQQPIARIKVHAETSNMPIWKRIVVKSKLPDRIKTLHDLSRNLWWCWNYRASELFEMIDDDLWHSTNKNPIQLIDKVSYDRLSQLANDNGFTEKLDSVYNEFKNYLAQPYSTKQSIAYFSMEYGLNTNLKIYSGGLGILAGDYLKEVSDCRVNMVAVGLLYKFGYFRQALSLNGDQMANYEPQELSQLPIEEVRAKNGEPALIEIDLPGRNVYAKVWKVSVGRIPLYLLDTDNNSNNPQDREITHKLYGGDWENRLKQEMLLGLGGIRLLKLLEHNCDLYHCNEGHAALINVQRLTNLIEEKLSFTEAMEMVRASSLFTTHTPVPAGHDSFEEDMFRMYMRHFPEKLNISWEDFMSLGRENPSNPNEKFSMSVLALKTSQEVNGVSWLHGEVSKNMFRNIWKGYFQEEVPIGFVTNGVHYGTWTAVDWQRLYEKEFGSDFLSDLSNKKHWEQIYNVSDQTVWETRKKLRKKLLDFIKARIEKNMVNRHEDPSQVLQVLEKINENALTIGFARRFATYKRAHLLFTDLDRLSRIVNNPKQPVQFIFAGKAHPADGAGQGLIRHIVEISKRPEFVGKIVFLENYDMELGKRLVTGVDIWMNTPTRPLEASGTSGQKAELNGVLNFSVLDGWWYEGYNEGAGWSLTEKRTYENQQFQDELDAATIYSMFENEIIPLYYNQDENGVPKQWVQYIKNSIAHIAPEFTTKRMLDDYLDRFYNKLYDRFKLLKANEYQKAIEIAAYKRKVLAGWNDIEVMDIEMPDIWKVELGIGDIYEVNVILDLKKLTGIDVGIEMVFTDLSEGQSTKILSIKEFEVTKKEGSKVYYSLKNVLKLPGVFNFGIRMFPKNSDLPYKQDFGLVRWI